MRLIDTKTLKLHEFIGSYIPAYAILSHTWGNDEVSFQEMTAGTAVTKTKQGYEKIKRCCEIAVSDGFQWAWVDTCCIDKTSSAELSEAINSMYQWYQESRVCYVILGDVPSQEDCYAENSSFRRSRWFTRGWTLQELIAPASVIFYGQDWREIGTKSSLHNLVFEITNIHEELIVGARYLDAYSIAQKMSWASRRGTTRTEDIAYCLLGLFEINMPLLYGEGRKAFIRLQEHIVQSSNDDSILAWTEPWNDSKIDGAYSGCLATSPADFAKAGNIVFDDEPTYSLRHLNSTEVSLRREHSTITNAGLRIELEALYEGKNTGDIRVVLRCEDNDSKSRVVLKLSKFGFLSAYVRCHISDLITRQELQQQQGVLMTIYISLHSPVRDFSDLASPVLFACNVETRGLQENGIMFAGMSPGLECLDTSAPTFCWWEGTESRTDDLSTLRFYDSHTNSYFEVILQYPTSWGSHTLKPVGTLEVGSIRPVPSNQLHRWPRKRLREGTPSDRMNWHDQTGKIRIKVIVRPHGDGKLELTLDPRSTYGTLQTREAYTIETYKVEQSFKVTIDYDGPEDPIGYRSISLEMMSRLPELEIVKDVMDDEIL